MCGGNDVQDTIRKCIREYISNESKFDCREKILYYLESFPYKKKYAQYMDTTKDCGAKHVYSFFIDHDWSERSIEIFKARKYMVFNNAVIIINDHEKHLKGKDILKIRSNRIDFIKKLMNQYKPQLCPKEYINDQPWRFIKFCSD